MLFANCVLQAAANPYLKLLYSLFCEASPSKLNPSPIPLPVKKGLQGEGKNPLPCKVSLLH